jgi:peptidyl-prolyl cis-trans isomerase D
MPMVMRKMRDSTKIIMLVTALAFVGLMVFQWGMDITGRSTGGGLGGAIGRVDGTPVSYDRYMASYRNLYDQVQRGQEEPISSQQNREIEDAAWDEVVNQVLIQQELARRGIQVTDEEILQAARFNPPPEFRENPAFQTGGVFDLQKYQQFLASPAADDFLLLQLEAYYRDVIPRGKLLRQVSSGIYVTDQELWEGWRDLNDQVTVRYVAMDPGTRVADDEVEVSDGEIRSYYVEQEHEFGVPARATVKVAVLPKTPLAVDSAASLEQASQIRRELLAGADFAEVAARESADPGSATNGGDLGTFARGQMVQPFDEYVFGANIGELSEPILTSFGYHVIEVMSRAGDSAQARHILVEVSRTDESELQLLTLADSLDELAQDLSLDEAAGHLGLATTPLVVTPDFAFAAGAGSITEGADWALEEAQTGEVSPVFETSQAFYALELVESEAARTLTLEEALPSIEQTLRFRKKMERVMEEGGAWAERVRSEGMTLDELAAEHGLEVREAGPFGRSDFVPGLGRQNAAIGAAFGLTEGEVSDLVVTDTDAFILELVSRTPADSAAWEAQKEDQRLQLQGAFRQQRLAEWLEGLRENADISDQRAQVLRPVDETETLIPPVF